MRCFFCSFVAFASQTKHHWGMIAVLRHREILAELTAKGAVRVSDLAQRFKVTEETIRRDLEKLAGEGRLLRAHGGATLQQDLDQEAPYWQRELINEDEKSAIAREAVKRVKPGTTIVLDASSTAWYMARLLPDLSLTVLTNSSQVAVALARHKSIKVIISGGILSPASLSFVGPLAEETIARYHADTAFLSCRAVDVEHGASDANELQAMVRRSMLNISDRHILMADHSKLGRRALAAIAPISQFHEAITDSKATKEQLHSLRATIGRVTVASPHP